MGNSIAGEKSFCFAIRVVKLCRFLYNEKREYVSSKQLLRCGTSIGANIHEALQAQGKKDFLSKISIALKEANESLYWIKLLHATEYLNDRQTDSIFTECDEIVKILVSIVKTTKQNLES